MVRHGLRVLGKSSRSNSYTAHAHSQPKFLVRAKSVENGYKITHSALEHSRACSGGGRKRAPSISFVAAPVSSLVGSVSSAKEKRKLIEEQVGMKLSSAAVWRVTESSVEQQLLQQIYEFALLPHYLKQAKKDDPEGTYFFASEVTDYAEETFKWCYCAPSSSKKYWKHDHLMFSMDGGFLSWHWRENLLIAVAKDADDKLQILAYGEFLQLLKQDFDDIHKCLVMSDQDKGADAACTEHDLTQANCTRHMTPNMVKATKFSITTIAEQLLGMIAKSCCTADYEVHMKDLKKLPKGAKAHKWLDERKSQFASHHFAGEGVFNFKDVTSNNAESMMNALKAEREVPILSLIDGILQWVATKKLLYNAAACPTTPEAPPTGLTHAAKEHLRDLLTRARHCKVAITKCTEQELCARVVRHRLRLKSDLQSWIEEPVAYKVSLKCTEHGWEVECSCGEPKATGTICVDGVAASLVVPKLKLPAETKAALVQLYSMGDERWHYTHFHAATWRLQHEHTQPLPSFVWQQGVSVEQVTALLSEEGCLPLAPPVGRAKVGRLKRKKQVRRKEERAKSRHEKKSRRASQSRGVAVVQKVNPRVAAPPPPLPDEIEIGTQVSLSELLDEEQVEEVEEQLVQKRKRRNRNTACVTCGQDHSTASCRLLNTRYVLKAQARRRSAPMLKEVSAPRIFRAPVVRKAVDTNICTICAKAIRASHSKSQCSGCPHRAHFDCVQALGDVGGRKKRVWTCSECVAE